MSESQPRAGLKRSGEYAPAGELQGVDQTFGSAAIARAFGVEEVRVHNALQGEFDLGSDAEVDSKQAQQLAEVLLGDQPLDQREAALMTLGAFTPRPDHDHGRGENEPREDSDTFYQPVDKE